MPALNDSLLRHNGELTAYVGRLSAERQGLLCSNAELEQKLSALQHTADTRTQQVCFLSVCSQCWRWCHRQLKLRPYGSIEMNVLLLLLLLLSAVISFTTTTSVLLAFFHVSLG